MKLVKVEFIEESKADAFFNVTIEFVEHKMFRENIYRNITRRAILSKEVNSNFYNTGFWMNSFRWSEDGNDCFDRNIISEMILQYEKCIN